MHRPSPDWLRPSPPSQGLAAAREEPGPGHAGLSPSSPKDPTSQAPSSAAAPAPAAAPPAPVPAAPPPSSIPAAPPARPRLPDPGDPGGLSDLFDTRVARIGRPIERTGLNLVVQDHLGNVLHLLALTPGETVIGRTEGDILFPKDPFLSPRHLAVAWDGGSRIVVRDLGSLNGVFVRRTGAVDLGDGDEFLVGSQWFRYRATWDEPARPEGDGTVLFGSAGYGAADRLVNRRAGGEIVGIHPIPRELVIGREGDAAYPEDPLMARRHARVVLHDEGLRIHDLGTGRGIFVRVREPFEAQDGDLLLAGTRLFKVKRSEGR